MSHAPSPAGALPRFSPRRELGRTGFLATQIGIGDVADRKVPLDTCVATLRRALASGSRDPELARHAEEILGSARLTTRR